MNDKMFFIAVAALTVGALIFAVLYSTRGDTNPVSASSPGGRGSASIASSNSSSKDQAPDFTLESLTGGNITLSNYRGSKYVILDFFATWCPNCQRDMPKLSKMYEKYKDQVEVIGVDLRESKNKVQKFVDFRGIVFPIVLDPGSRVSRLYGIRYTNTHILIDKDGNIVREIPGDIRESDILSLIQ